MSGTAPAYSEGTRVPHDKGTRTTNESGETMTWTCRDCDTTIAGSKAEHCTVCHETFGGTVAGDAHRVGAYETYSRRCLTVGEMLGKGMARNDRGVWSQPGAARSAERLRALSA